MKTDTSWKVKNEKYISKKKTKPKKQNNRTPNHKNYIDQGEDLSTEVPRAMKKKRREAELSDFEKNVFIEERKKMERELGLHNLSAEIRNQKHLEK